MADLDQSGNVFQKARVYLGPSLGWVETQIKPAQLVTTAGATQLTAGASVVLVNVAAAVSIVLPDVAAWLKEQAYQPATAFDRGIWIKDLGGNAASFNITVVPATGQTIDTLASYALIANHAIGRFYPLTDLSGWYSA